MIALRIFFDFSFLVEHSYHNIMILFYQYLQCFINLASAMAYSKMFHKEQPLNTISQRKK